jgi:hypothetical protein
LDLTTTNGEREQIYVKNLMQFSGVSTDIAHDSDKQKCANETTFCNHKNKPHPNG